MKTLSFFTTLTIFFLAIFGCYAGGSDAKIPEDDFVPVVRVISTSDTHINSLAAKGTRRVAQMMKTAYSMADADADYSNVDAFIFTGDITDAGDPTQYWAFAGVTKPLLRDETELLGVVAKSHDSNHVGRKSRQWIEAITGNPADFDAVLNGIHFIGVSVSADESVHYSEEQIQWLDDTIAAAVAEDPSKPVFVYQHEHIRGTVYGGYAEDGWGMDYFTDVLNKYPQVIDFSGHSHYPANDPRAIYQDVFTAVNDGGMNYFEFNFEDVGTYHPDGNGNQEDFVITEVDADGNVMIRVFDLLSETFIAEYYIDDVAAPVKTKYNQERRRAAAQAPYFPDGASVQVKKSAGRYTFTFPAAKCADDDIVFDYRLDIYNENNEIVHTEYLLSDYYYADRAASFTFKGVAAKGVRAEITAKDAWGLVSAPISAEF